MIRIGVIGCGHWGSNYLRVLNFMEEVEIVAACDSNTKPFQRIKRQYPQIQQVEKPELIFENPRIDAVVIATPASTHFELVKKSLEAGKHTLVEKPLALTLPEAERLVDLADTAKKTLMVGHTFLYNPAVRKMKECIDRGVLGKIYYLQATRTHLGLFRNDVSAVWDLAPHDVSIFSYLLGQEPKKVSAVGTRHLNSGLEDVAFMNLFYDNGILGNIHISWIDSNKLRQVAVIGSKARVLFNDLDPLERIRIFEKGVSIDKPYDSFGEFQLLLRDGDIISPKVEAEEPLRNVCLDFIQSIQTGKPPLADGRNGLNVVRTLSAIQRSIEREGEPVSLSAASGVKTR